MKKSKKIGLSLNKKVVSKFNISEITGGSTAAWPGTCPSFTCGGFTQGVICQQSEQLPGGCNHN